MKVLHSRPLAAENNRRNRRSQRLRPARLARRVQRVAQAGRARSEGLRQVPLPQGPTPPRRPRSSTSSPFVQRNSRRMPPIGRTRRAISATARSEDNARERRRISLPDQGVVSGRPRSRTSREVCRLPIRICPLDNGLSQGSGSTPDFQPVLSF